MTLDDHFRAIGDAALRKLPKVELYARVNAFDHFLLVAAGPVEDAIIGSIDASRDDHCAWMNAYCGTPAPHQDRGGRWTTLRSAYVNPLNRDICRAVYEALRA